MQLTEEQQRIIAYVKQMKRGDRLKVEAKAGSGKTSTLVEVAKANPDKRFLYLAFNKAIVNEAKGKFPKNVVVKTTHSLAYGKIVTPLVVPVIALVDQLLGGRSVLRLRGDRDQAQVDHAGKVKRGQFRAEHCVLQAGSRRPSEANR